MEQEQQFDKLQRQGKKRTWPPLGLWISASFVIALIIVSIIATLYLFKDIATDVIIISTVVIGLLSIMLMFFQWAYPKPASESKPSTTSFPMPLPEPIAQQLHSSNTTTNNIKSVQQRNQRVSSENQGATTTLESAHNVFFFTQFLPKLVAICSGWLESMKQ
jgi:hypothetical protein